MVFTTGQSRRAKIILQSIITFRHATETKGTTGFKNKTHLVIILHDSPLPSTGVNPSNKVLHSPRNQHGRVSHWCRSYSDMTLLDSTYGVRDGFGHFETGNDNSEASSGDGGDSYFVFNVRGLGADV